jgi:phage-related protein
MGFWDSVKSWVSNTYNKVKDGVSNVWNNNVKPWVNRIPVIGSALSSGIEGLGNVINQGAGQIGNMANQKLKDALKSGVDYLSPKIPIVGGALGNLAKGEIDKMKHGGLVGSHLPKRYKHTFQK